MARHLPGPPHPHRRPHGIGQDTVGFLTCLDALVRQGIEEPLPDVTQVVYVSPLKALSNDIQKNLAAPLEEIAALGEKLGVSIPDIRVAVRTGDTKASERQKMDRQPPHILITSKSGRRDLLRSEIQRHLEAIGLNGGRALGVLSKDAIRRMHRFHREAAQQRIRRALGDKIDLFLEEIANGDEVDPANIRPELVEARSGARTGDLFRFASLLWSIPVSQGYGRRLRYLVKDRANGKLIGIFALGDPVFNLRIRDEWIGWNQADRRERLVNLMDAYVVGAVLPYADLLARIHRRSGSGQRSKPESTEGRPWGQPLKKPAGAPLNLG